MKDGVLTPYEEWRDEFKDWAKARAKEVKEEVFTHPFGRRPLSHAEQQQRFLALQSPEDWQGFLQEAKVLSESGVNQRRLKQAIKWVRKMQKTEDVNA